MSLRAVNLAKIHIAKAQLGMDDDTYRALLARVAGVRSAKDLGPRQMTTYWSNSSAWAGNRRATGRAGRRQKCLKTGKPCCVKSPRSWPAPIAPGATPTTWPGACSRSSGSSGWTTASSTG